MYLTCERKSAYKGSTYFQTMAFSEALYLAFPFRQINWTPDVFSGVGILTSIFCPSSDGLKFDFRTTFTSILVRPTSRTNGITRKGNEMSLVVRYLKLITYYLHNTSVLYGWILATMFLRTILLMFSSLNEMVCIFKEFITTFYKATRIRINIRNSNKTLQWNSYFYFLKQYCTALG